MVERRLHKAHVAGSIPAPATLPACRQAGYAKASEDKSEGREMIFLALPEFPLLLPSFKNSEYFRVFYFF